MSRRFKWDQRKNVANVAKHYLAFEDAVLVFDCNRIEIESDRSGEKRTLTIGEVNGIVIAVAYTEKENVTRIISARRASRKERKAYHEAYPR